MELQPLLSTVVWLTASTEASPPTPHVGSSSTSGRCQEKSRCDQSHGAGENYQAVSLQARGDHAAEGRDSSRRLPGIPMLHIGGMLEPMHVEAPCSVRYSIHTLSQSA